MGKVTHPSPATFADEIPERGKSDRAARLIRLLREPLVHFLLIGLALFVAYQAFHPAADQAGSYEILLTTNDVRQLQSTFAAQWQRVPSPEEMRGLIEQKIREEVLYREALRLGLDKDDVIIKRRLAQKMQFLAEDVAAAHQPTTAELTAWYTKNRPRLTIPSRFSFRHLYFSPDRRGPQAHYDAMRALSKIGAEPEASKAAADLADRFMFQDYYADRTPAELEKEFGAQFAASMQKLKPGAWQGPVESGYGWHLVFVDSVIPGRVPVFEEVEADARNAWLADQKQQAWQKAFEDLRAKYTVVLPAIPDRTASPTLTDSSKIEKPAASGEAPE